MRPSPAESKWASKCSRSPSTQHACGDVPVAKNLIIQQNFARKPYRFVHGAGGGVTEERGAVPLPLAQTVRTHIALSGWGAPSIALDFWQTNKITNMHAILSRNQSGQTDTTLQHNNQQTCTHNPTILTCRPAPKPTTNSNTENSYYTVDAGQYECAGDRTMFRTNR